MLHTENAWLTEKAFGSDRVFRLDFDRLEDEPSRLMRDVLHFLEEDWCEDCLAPLATKTNSSEVERDRGREMKRVALNSDYRKAKKLYQDLSREVSDEQRQSAMHELEQLVDTHLTNRPLL